MQLIVNIGEEDNELVVAAWSQGFMADPESLLTEDQQRGLYAQNNILAMIQGGCKSYRINLAVKTARMTAAALPPPEITVETGE